MGAIASYGSVHQEWYMERMAQILAEHDHLKDLVLLRTLMAHFLWWDYVLMPRWRDVWKELGLVVPASEEAQGGRK